MNPRGSASRRALGSGAWLLAWVAACGPAADQPSADAGPADAGPLPYDASTSPETLSQSGLYYDTAAQILAPGVRPFEPRFELWTDGAEKRRWIYLPAGAVIDNAEPDFWEFPEGTRLWKEFSRDGLKLETRLLAKVGPAPEDWHMMAFAWNDDETDAVAVPFGEPNARGTGYPVPGEAACRACHERMTDRVIGFSAIQLDHAGEGVVLQDLLDERLLRYGTGAGGTPHFPLPGDELDRDILGYLHSNCGGCHNPRSDVLSGVTTRPIFLLRTDERFRGDIERTPVYTSAVGVRTTTGGEAGRYHISPGNPDDSAIYRRMSSRTPTLAMPPLGTDLVDEEAAARLRAWIEALPR
jgi:hypothetical protein